MMIFETTVDGIPCRAEVTFWSPYSPMRVTGIGFGDAEPAEPEEFEFEIRDRRGRSADWLDRKVTGEDVERLLREFHQIRKIEEEV